MEFKLQHGFGGIGSGEVILGYRFGGRWVVGAGVGIATQSLDPGGRPFLISFLVTDSLGATCICKLQWHITP